MINGATLNVLDYGATGDGITNDTAAIQRALDKLQPTGGILFFPNGIYLTDSIDLRGFKSITLTGTDLGGQPWLSTCQIKIRTACDVGIQMADIDTNNSTNSGTAITIQNLYLNCNNLATTGMNMNYNVTVTNVAVRYALGDGIVFEGFTYPVYLKNVNVQYCGKNGLYVKGPLTTVYNVCDSGFSNNDGYGILIEAGAYAIFNNVSTQSNKVGGLKIYNKNPATYTRTNYLTGINFTNFYSENSGTLSGTNPVYEGNYAIYVGSYNETPTDGTGKITRLLFIECQFNKTPSIGNTSRLGGLSSDTVFVNSNINYNNMNTALSLLQYNVNIGYRASYNTSAVTNDNVSIGKYANAGDSSGTSNTVVGAGAMQYTTGNRTGNSAFGTNALAVDQGDYNTGLGYGTLYANLGGSNNTAIGRDAGNGTGGGAANANTTGSNNTFVGNGAVGASATASNVITLGNSSVSTLRCQVTSITALSDARDKTNVKSLNAGLDFVNKLNPVSFDWNMRDGGKVGVADSGFIAQELQSAQQDCGIEIPGLVYDENPEKLEAAYGKLIPSLVKAIQELSAKVKELENK